MGTNRVVKKAVEVDAIRRFPIVSIKDRNVIVKARMGIEGTTIHNLQQKQLTWHARVQRMREGRLPKLAT